jgi:hypothetical protein
VQQIPGYLEAAEDSHVAVAAAVAGGSADVGPGVEAAAREFGLEFIPLVEEDYYLVCLKDALETDALRRLREMLASPEWLARLLVLPGCAPRAQAGAVADQALPWWHYRAPGLSRSVVSPSRRDAAGIASPQRQRSPVALRAAARPWREWRWNSGSRGTHLATYSSAVVRWNGRIYRRCKHLAIRIVEEDDGRV